MLVRIAYGEDPDQGLHCLSRPFKQTNSVQNFTTFTVRVYMNGTCGYCA